MPELLPLRTPLKKGFSFLDYLLLQIASGMILVGGGGLILLTLWLDKHVMLVIMRIK